MNSMKGKMIGHCKMNLPGQEVPNMLLENNGKITAERMKTWNQSKRYMFGYMSLYQSEITK